MIVQRSGREGIRHVLDEHLHSLRAQIGDFRGGCAYSMFLNFFLFTLSAANLGRPDGPVRRHRGHGTTGSRTRIDRFVGKRSWRAAVYGRAQLLATSSSTTGGIQKVEQTAPLRGGPSAWAWDF